MIGEVKDRLGITAGLMALCPGIVLKPAGREKVCLSPLTAERTPSCYVDERKGTFYCFSTGQGGDVIRLAELVLGCGWSEAFAWCRRQAGLDTGVISDADRIAHAKRRAAERKAEADRLAAEDAAEAARKQATAQDIWRAARMAAGTPVETYLAARGIALAAFDTLYGFRVPPTLRYHGDLQYRWDGVTHRGPAMVALVTDAARAPTGVHRTWIARDGRSKAAVPKPKLTLGTIWGSSIRLTPVAAHCVVGEGIETTLTVVAALALRGERAFGLAGISLGNLAADGFRLPDGVRRLTILEDADSKKPEIARATYDRAIAIQRRRGLDVRSAAPSLGRDFNDMARGAA